MRSRRHVALGFVLALVGAGVWWKARASVATLPPEPLRYQTDGVLGARLVPGKHRLPLFRGGTEIVWINDHGYRGNGFPVPGPDQILLVGDAQVFGLGIAEHDTVAARLSARLPEATVLEASSPSYGPHEYVEVVREVLHSRALSMVIVVLDLGTDVLELDAPARDRLQVRGGKLVSATPLPFEMPPADLYSAALPAISLRAKAAHQRYARLEEEHRATVWNALAAFGEAERQIRDVAAFAPILERERAHQALEKRTLAASWRTCWAHHAGECGLPDEPPDPFQTYLETLDYEHAYALRARRSLLSDEVATAVRLQATSELAKTSDYVPEHAAYRAALEALQRREALVEQVDEIERKLPTGPAGSSSSPPFSSWRSSASSVEPRCWSPSFPCLSSWRAARPPRATRKTPRRRL